MLSAMFGAILSAAISPPPAVAAPRYSCEKIEGLEAVSIPPGEGLRFIILGEMHGTVQQPRFFGNLVCNLSLRHPLNVLIELATSSTPAIQAYVASDGSPEAKRLFLSDAIWDPKIADGRNSEAMFELIERLRKLKQSGADLQVYGTQPDYLETADQFYGELARANDWAKIAASRSQALNVVFVGAAHAALKDNGRYGFIPAAGHLRPSDIFAIGPIEEGGEQWSLDVSPTGQPLIGVHKVKGRPVAKSGITVVRDASSGWNAIYTFGEPAHPSSPARR